MPRGPGRGSAIMTTAATRPAGRAPLTDAGIKNNVIRRRMEWNQQHRMQQDAERMQGLNRCDSLVSHKEGGGEQGGITDEEMGDPV